LCQNLGDKKKIFEYEYVSTSNKKEWVEKEFRKGWNINGECKWINMANGMEEKTDFEINNSRTQPVDCSVSNVLCSQQKSYKLSEYENLDQADLRHNVLPYIIDPEDETGERCILDTNYSCDSCQRDVKYGYKLNTTQNKYERRIYTRRVIDNRCAYFDNQGFCCPQTICPDEYNFVNVNQFCAFEAPSNLFNTIDKGEECKNLPTKFCSNLDERDYFMKTKFIPRLKADGTNCEYRSANLEDSRIIPIDNTNNDIVDGFKCWERQRLCKNKDEFRNSSLGKCTKCPNGKFLKEENRAAFDEESACTPIANCDDQLETCYVTHTNTQEGIVTKKELFQKQNDPSDLSQCISHKNKPSDCQTECYHEKHGDFCINCSDGIDSFNPLKEECDKLPKACSDGLKYKCMDSHDHVFYEYQKRHVNNDRFDINCEYYRNVNIDDGGAVNDDVMNYEVTLNVDQCQVDCPVGFVCDRNEASGIESCIFPRCEGTVTYTVYPSDEHNDQGKFSNIYHNLELGGFPHYSNDFCKYTKSSRIETLQMPEGFEKCYLYDDTKFSLENGNLEDHTYEINKIYSFNTPSNVHTKEYPANICSSDCSIDYDNGGTSTMVINKDSTVDIYSHEETVTTTINKINKEATGNGKKCTEYGGTVVWGTSINNKFPNYTSAINNYDSKNYPPVNLTNKRFLLKTNTTYKRPTERSCSSADIITKENTSEQPEFIDKNSCNKKKRHIKTYKPGTKKIIHTSTWYKLEDCGTEDMCQGLNPPPDCYTPINENCPPCEFSVTYKLDNDNDNTERGDPYLLRTYLEKNRSDIRGAQNIVKKQTLVTKERCQHGKDIYNVDNNTPQTIETQELDPLQLTPEASCGQWSVNIPTVDDPSIYDFDDIDDANYDDFSSRVESEIIAKTPCGSSID
jgi:hypothetical protein